MRRISLLILCLIMTVLGCFPVCAEREPDRGILHVMEWSQDYTSEMTSVELTVRLSDSEWDRYLGDDRDEVAYDLMYQVYYLDIKDIVGAYDRNGNFADNITDRYFWVVCNYNLKKEVQVVRSEQENSGWDIRRGTRYQSDIEANHTEVSFDTVSIYNKIYEEFPDADSDSFRIVQEENLDLHIVYFTDNGTEYVVPYFPSKDIKWITNGTAYRADEFVELMRVNTAEDSVYISSHDPQETPSKIFANYVVIGSAVVIAIAVAAVIVAKNKKKKNYTEN